MTRGGACPILRADQTAWTASAERVVAEISSGKVEAIGRNTEEVSELVPRTALAGIPVLSPANLEFRYIQPDSPTHIRCHWYVGHDEWHLGCNDGFFPAGSGRARWSHLQVSRSTLLKRWPKPSSTAKAELSCFHWLLKMMRESPEHPRPKAEIQSEARKLFPRLGVLGFRRAWDLAIKEAPAPQWKRAGRRPKKSNQPTN
jgi:hypothetical protein